MYKHPPQQLLTVFNCGLSDFQVDGYSNYENMW